MIRLRFSSRPVHSERVAVSNSHSASSDCGITRVPASTDMKLLSPDQRGTMCQCKWPGQARPGDAAQIQPDVEPLGLQPLAEHARQPREPLHAFQMLVAASSRRACRRAAAARPSGGRCCTG